MECVPGMTLEETFYLSQTIASVAVVGSLIYLGLQVRYAERAQRGIMQQDRADRTSHAALTLAQGGLASIWHRGAAGDPSSSGLRKRRRRLPRTTSRSRT